MLQMTGIAVLVFSCAFMLPAFLKNKRFVIVVCCMYAIGFLHFTLLSRKPSQDAVISLQLFKYLRKNVSFDYVFFM